MLSFFFQAEDGIRDYKVTGVQTCALPISGVGATPGAKRLPLAEAQTITKIPVLPLSYGDAQPLLAAVRGPMAPDAWRGALPLTYRIGPGPAKVHLRVKSDWSTKPLYDVIARLPGASAADQWIMRGNHHDAWVN